MSQASIPRVALYFDAAFTLIKPRQSVGEQYASVARRFGCNPDAGLLTKHFHPAFQDARKGRQAAMIGDDQQTRQFWAEVVHEIYNRAGQTLPPDPYTRDLFDAFATGDVWSVYPDAEEALTLSRSLGFRMGVLSNFDNRLHPLLEDLDLEHHFNTKIVSCDVGVEKPDPEIFRIAAEHLPAKQYAIIGDTFGDDIKGGMNAGWIAIHIQRDQPDPVIEHEGWLSVNSLVEGVKALADHTRGANDELSDQDTTESISV